MLTQCALHCIAGTPGGAQRCYLLHADFPRRVGASCDDLGDRRQHQRDETTVGSADEQPLRSVWMTVGRTRVEGERGRHQLGQRHKADNAKLVAVRRKLHQHSTAQHSAIPTAGWPMRLCKAMSYRSRVHPCTVDYSEISKAP
jgi:hypothetical protein